MHVFLKIEESTEFGSDRAGANANANANAVLGETQLVMQN